MKNQLKISFNSKTRKRAQKRKKQDVLILESPHYTSFVNGLQSYVSASLIAREKVYRTNYGVHKSRKEFVESILSSDIFSTEIMIAKQNNNFDIPKNLHRKSVYAAVAILEKKKTITFVKNYAPISA